MKLLTGPLKNYPSVVYVIRKKNTPQMSWWKNNSDTYYSSILNEKRTLYTFFSNESATNCLSFINKYKLINNKYPPGDSLMEPGELYIDSDTVFYLQHNCLLNGLGLVGITAFDYTFCKTFLDKKNVFNLTVSGVDLLENHDLGIPDYVSHLNYLLTT